MALRNCQRCPADLDHLLDLLEFGRYCVQDKEHHPEGDVLNHSLQVFSHAIREIGAVVPDSPYERFHVVLAALLHDIGKIGDSKGHDAFGAKLIEDFVREDVTWLVKNHMRFWTYQLGEMKRPGKVYEITHDLILFHELSLIARWDKMGRNPNRKMVYNRDKIINQLTSLL